jgi:hypothetical protein
MYITGNNFHFSFVNVIILIFLNPKRGVGIHFKIQIFI